MGTTRCNAAQWPNGKPSNKASGARQRRESQFAKNGQELDLLQGCNLKEKKKFHAISGYYTCWLKWSGSCERSGASHTTRGSPRTFKLTEWLHQAETRKEKRLLSLICVVQQVQH